MAVKVTEACPRCGEVTPTSDQVVVTANVPWRPWVYRCRCGWIWANEAQRKHNGHARHRAVRDSMVSNF